MALVCDAQALAEFAPNDAISLSHKILLLPVQDLEQKKAPGFHAFIIDLFLLCRDRKSVVWERVFRAV